MSNEEQMQPIDRVVPELKEYWRYWNVGNISYFQRAKQRKLAKLTPWHHTPRKAASDYFRSVIDPDRGGRWVPAGHYVSLAVFQATHDEDVKILQGEDPAWEMVMTDTPDEMNDHADVILNARGKVLIHGLGLGCVLNCLLHKPEVNQIDVVEANPDVIALVARFYYKKARKLNKKLAIYHASCVDMKWPPGTRWNYIWHDIWTQISVSNLRQDEGDPPEHGISYELLHRMFGGRCDRQGSWAYERAKAQREVIRYEERVAAAYASTWNLRTPEERMEMLHEVVESTLMGMDIDTYIAFLKMDGNEAGHQLLAQWDRAVRDTLTPFEAKMLLGDSLRRYAQRMTNFTKNSVRSA